MVSAPLIRRLGASLAHHARGFCHTVDAAAADETSTLTILSLLEQRVKVSGKQLASLLRQRIEEEEKARRLLLQSLEQRLEEAKQANRRLEHLVEAEMALLAKEQVDLLQARGLNNARGLFELLQERLAQAPNITPGKKGPGLWEEILQSNVGLATCIHQCTKVSASDRSRQALQIYNVYAVLSQHVHAGKHLADLQAQSGGVVFHPGPLSPEQVQVLLCLGSATGVTLVEGKIH